MILTIAIFIIVLTLVFIKDSVDAITFVWVENPKFAIISILVIIFLMYFFFLEPLKLFYEFLETGVF
jgi:hypothetical protein